MLTLPLGVWKPLQTGGVPLFVVHVHFQTLFLKEALQSPLVVCECAAGRACRAPGWRQRSVKKRIWNGSGMADLPTLSLCLQGTLPRTQGAESTRWATSHPKPDL